MREHIILLFTLFGFLTWASSQSRNRRLIETIRADHLDSINYFEAKARCFEEAMARCEEVYEEFKEADTRMRRGSFSSAGNRDELASERKRLLRKCNRYERKKRFLKEEMQVALSESASDLFDYYDALAKVTAGKLEDASGRGFLREAVVLNDTLHLANQYKHLLILLYIDDGSS